MSAKVYISADMEGASGITSFHQVSENKREFEHHRVSWTNNINLLIQGALDGGAKEILVNESHDGMNYLLPDLIHPAAQYISGRLKSKNQMEGIDETFNIAFLFAHARAGQAGVLSHSFVVPDIFDIKLNDLSIGELGLNAAMAGAYNVPVGLVIGDDATSNEAVEIMPNVRTVITKEYITQFTAKCLPSDKVNNDLRNAAKEVVKNYKNFEPLIIEPPYRLEVTFTIPAMTELISYIPGVKVIEPRRVIFESNNYLELTKIRILIVNLAKLIGNQVRAASL